ncbi:hypothetical protein IX27_19685 [Streptomyces sp. JS01]|uniref:Uncharacterized protein n=3 Tax=Streptomyces TaxID=1883 RepID=A0A1E7LT36_9ACTN|nr:hypothetical protein [Streptomyces parvus]KAA6203932.1 hypothetical protein F2B00_02090 [Streptomyces parvus]KFK88099.1 hypothetical protein IX27_19685 [Streptomyces sp. JS01]OEV19083.1 hypothetical protein AN221_19360 [Streptomyces nanshensis]GGS40206.1 hypothetical protein GCM10010221_43480 [Streptomyces parvus]
MRPLLFPRTASPASGVLRGARAAVLAMLCVLLPMAGHVLTLGHAPQWVVVAMVGLVAVPGAVFLTRRRLTDGQLLVVLVAAQVAHHATYALPGMCRAAAGVDGTSNLPSWVEHGATLQLPAGSMISGHVITLLVAARVLGVTEQMLWRSRPLLDVVLRLLAFVWPLLVVRGNGPQDELRATETPVKPAVLVRLRSGRAPPRAGGLLVRSRLMPVGRPVVC